MVFSSTRKIKIQNDLYDRLTAVAQKSGYSSTEELIVHVLEREAKGSGNDQKPTDQEEAERQLRGLGYID